jgi:hypothetical protein
MTSQRYVVVVIDQRNTGTRVFGPMGEKRAAQFRDGLRKRYPELSVVYRPAWRDTYTNAATVIAGMLR